MSQGLVIFEYLERCDIPLPPYLPTDPYVPVPDLQDRCQRLDASTVVANVASLCRQFQFSPLQIFCQRTYMFIEDDHILPNSHAKSVVLRTLQNGREMLFYPEDVANYHRSREVSHAASYFSWIAEELCKDQLDLLVVLVPEKYSVYQPLVRGAEVAREGTLYLDHVEEMAKAAGVPVVNLLSRFRREAADGLDRDQYLYWRDDTHWNPTGIEIAAQEIQRAWEALSPPPGDELSPP
jgi:hypothetical protein